MSKDKKEKKANVVMDPFQQWSHSKGRIGTLIMLIYMVAIPFIVLGYYDAIPSLGEVFNLAEFQRHLVTHQFLEVPLTLHS